MLIFFTDFVLARCPRIEKGLRSFFPHVNGGTTGAILHCEPLYHLLLP